MFVWDECCKLHFVRKKFIKSKSLPSGAPKVSYNKEKITRMYDNVTAYTLVLSSDNWDNYEYNRNIWMIIKLIGSEVVNFRRNDYIKQFVTRIKDRTYMWSGWLIKLIIRPVIQYILHWF